MAREPSDRNLLVGMLAFQNGLVRREQLLSAMSAWLVEKQTPLDEILRRQGALEPDSQTLLLALVAKHLAMHDNAVERSLAALGSVRLVHDALRSLADPDLNASLQQVTAIAGNAERFTTFAPTIGAITSEGGRFRILRPHARGGLGEVHVALDTELNREVALKEIQACHADNLQSRARFTLEAEITGGLEHPSIVPVYGLGAYADGRPYYAMRFIRGDTLAERIEKFHRKDATGLDAGQRTLELHKLLRRFIDVCEAIQYAHDRGILHRDLKPGNIMLGKYGETLVVDWGLAKPLAKKLASGPGHAERECAASHVAFDELPLVPSSASGSAPTQMGAVVGTPAYMSPEQAAGRLDQLGPASDVYSLGATLYTVLTGRAPFEVTEGGIGELLKRVSDGDFPRPRQVSLTVPKPLEAICLKATAKTPADRYATPAQLRDDLEHWLADEPVTAITETLVERSARFVRKHKSWTLATAAALLLVTLVSTAASLLINDQRNEIVNLAADNLQLAKNEESARKSADAKRAEAETARTQAQANARRADEQSDLALKTLNTVVYSIQSELAEIPAARPVRQKLLTHALDGLHAVAGAADTAREASRSQWFTHDELGAMFTLLGSPQAAEEYRTAHEIAKRLAEADPANAQAQRDLSVSFNKLGGVSLSLGNVPEAKTHFEQSLKISHGLAAADPANDQAQRDLMVAYSQAGNVNLTLGNVPAAKKHFEQGLEICRRLAEADPENAQAQRDLSVAYNKLGGVSRSLGNLPEAKGLFEQALEISRRLAEADPENAQAQRDLLVSFDRLGATNLLLGNVPEAKKHYEQALEISRRLADADPQNAQAQRDLSVSYSKLGELSLASENVPEAKKHYEQALEISRRLAEADPVNVQAQRDLSISYSKLGELSLAVGNVPEAKKHFEQDLKTSRTLAEADPKNAQAQRDLSVSYNKLGEVCLALGEAPEAKTHFEQGFNISRRLAEADPANAQAQRDLSISCNKLGDASMVLGNGPEAKKHFEQSLAIRRRLSDADPTNAQAQHDLSVSFDRLGNANLTLKNVPEAKKHFEQELQINRRLVEADPASAQAQVDLANSYMDLARCESAAKNYAAAKEHLTAGIAILTKLEAGGQLKNQAQWRRLLEDQRKLLAECERQLAAGND